MILDFTNKWNPGDIIGVKFINGTSKLHERVIECVKIWEKFANIKFDFTDSKAPIRIKFDSSSSDSKIGTEFLSFSDPVTMNFANLHEDSAEDELNHKILHEFGHALGLVHEHFNLEFLQSLKKDKIMDHFKRNVGLEEAEVNQNLLKPYIQNQLSYTEFDPDSIMTYDIPANCTGSGKQIKRNCKLSELDKKLISIVYPFEPAEPNELTSDGVYTFEMNELYEEKIYKFSVVPDEEKRYYLTADANDEIMLSLYRMENEENRTGHIEYLRPSNMINESTGKVAKIDLDEHITNHKPAITEYYVRITRVKTWEKCNGNLRLEIN